MVYDGDDGMDGAWVLEWGLAGWMDGWLGIGWWSVVGRFQDGWNQSCGGGNGVWSGAKEGLARGEGSVFFSVLLFLDLEGLLYCFSFLI
jgi:hypothetical protein